MAIAWTPELFERVRGLWREGKSAREIAALLGPGATRNAVLGALFRAGETRGAERRQRTAQRQPTRPDRETVAALRRAKAAAPKMAPPKPAAPPRLVAVNVEASARALTALRYGQCRWPLDMSADREATADSLFCGMQVRDETCPYCTAHAARAFVKPRAPLSVVATADRRQFNGRHFAATGKNRVFAE